MQPITCGDRLYQNGLRIMSVNTEITLKAKPIPHITAENTRLEHRAAWWGQNKGSNECEGALQPCLQQCADFESSPRAALWFCKESTIRLGLITIKIQFTEKMNSMTS